MRPRVFIAASAEDLLVASALADHLARDAEIMAWTEDVFTLSLARLQGVQRVFEAADCAVFVAGAARGQRRVTLSQNLAFELGISIGRLGADRTTILSDSRARLDLPSDLSGFECHTYEGSESLQGLRSALATPASRLRRWIRRLGHRSKRSAQRPDPDQVVSDATLRTGSTRAAGKRTGGRSVRDSVFISYARADEKWLARIRTMLTPLIRADRIELWDDTRIRPGTRWRREIEKAIASASVALLLVSPNFLASPFIADEELPPLLAAARTDGLVIVWALVSACLYKKSAIAEYQAAHPVTKPLDTLTPPRRNLALLAIAETIGTALGESKRSV